MRLHSIGLTNFRGFAKRDIALHPEFNLIIGENGAGKTSVLEALSVALGGWLQSFPGTDRRSIRKRDIRRIEQIINSRARSLSQFPVVVDAVGTFEINGLNSSAGSQRFSWTRSLESETGRTKSAETRSLKSFARMSSDAVQSGACITLPVIRYFGAGRLWEPVRSSDRDHPRRSAHMGEESAAPDTQIEMNNPFYGYRMSVDKRANPSDLLRWIEEERRNEIDLEENSPALGLVYAAIRSMLPELEEVRFELRRKTLILRNESGTSLRFEDMSDGYRNVISIAADLAIKITMLNPHLGQAALKETPGVVLIDEIDLHLHPRWQRRVCEDLRRTFPRVQFICTTHSPFIVQSLRTGEELINLDGQETGDTANLTLEEVAEGLMGVNHAETSQRYSKMKNTARAFLEEMDRQDLSSVQRFEAFKARMAEAIAPFADNPAYQAYLEMKLSKKAPRGIR
ncbi:AAA family ATPase [Pseudooceanicola nanhaiensis]|uniref:AAA family ATPase n=1 Tax=Pseudooceanicola nanhaiensis TaxID=375761 RepID=UPI00300B6260